MASVTTAEKTLPHCKKCNELHDKPINNKCECFKNIKDEKRDVSRESTTKKTPKNKATTEIAQGDKVFDLVLNTMSSFTDKLTAMEAQILGLTSRMNLDAGVTPVRKSRSCEKTKRLDTSETSEEQRLLDRNVLGTKDYSYIHSEQTFLFTQTFLDTVVTFKTNPTPARQKNPSLILT